MKKYLIYYLQMGIVPEINGDGITSSSQNAKNATIASVTSVIVVLVIIELIVLTIMFINKRKK